MTDPAANPQPAPPTPTPVPRSVEALLRESRRLRGEADRLERQAAELREAIRRGGRGVLGGREADRG